MKNVDKSPKEKVIYVAYIAKIIPNSLAASSQSRRLFLPYVSSPILVIA